MEADIAETTIVANSEYDVLFMRLLRCVRMRPEDVATKGGRYPIGINPEGIGTDQRLAWSLPVEQQPPQRPAYLATCVFLISDDCPGAEIPPPAYVPVESAQGSPNNG
jgi:hypothetical protein